MKVLNDFGNRRLGETSYITNNLDFQSIVQTERYGIQTPYFQNVGKDGDVVPSMAILDWADSFCAVLVLATYDHYVEGFGPGTSEVAIFVDDIQRVTSTLGSVESKTETLYLITNKEDEIKIELRARISDDIGGQTAWIDHARLSIIKLIRR